MHIRSTLSVLVGWLGPFVTAVMMVHFYEGVFFFLFFSLYGYDTPRSEF